MVNEFIAYKFNQIPCIHAESYPSAEFRHGPLAMLDEIEKTACKYLYLILNPILGIFVVLEDENMDQVLMNILQVKERGATITVVTNLKDIFKHIPQQKIDFLIEVWQ